MEQKKKDRTFEANVDNTATTALVNQDIHRSN